MSDQRGRGRGGGGSEPPETPPQTGPAESPAVPPGTRSRETPQPDPQQPPSDPKQPQPEPVARGFSTGLGVGLGAGLAVAVGALWWTYRLRQRLLRTADPGPPQVVTPEVARQEAWKAFEAHGLLQRPDWKQRLTARTPLEPVLVQQLGALRGGEAPYYYLVPIGTSEMSVGAVALVDGFGHYQEAEAFPTDGRKSWGAMMADWRTPAAMRRTLADGRFTPAADDTFGRESSAQSIGLSGSFVWTPCEQSRSPFLPFRVITTDDGVRYVRIDGRVFTALTAIGPLRSAPVVSASTPRAR